jgi:hypothetical protein
MSETDVGKPPLSLFGGQGTVTFPIARTHGFDLSPAPARTMASLILALFRAPHFEIFRRQEGLQ